MMWVAIGAMTDLNGLLTRENGERFLLTPVLTLVLTPLLYCCGWISRGEQDDLRKRWQERPTFF
jgi:hypothetical protein